MKTDLNKFGVLTTKAAAPANSWWTEPALQQNRAAFQQRLVTEELRMLGGKFGGKGKMFDKGLTEKMRHHRVLIIRSRLQRVDREADMKIGERYRLPPRFIISSGLTYEPQDITTRFGDVIHMDSTHATMRVGIETILARPGKSKWRLGLKRM